jgi:hypothetical protein
MPGQRNSFNGTGDYVEVKFRLAEFRAKHPEGSLQPADPTQPFQVVEIGGQTFIAYTPPPTAPRTTPSRHRLRVGAVPWQDELHPRLRVAERGDVGVGPCGDGRARRRRVEGCGLR